VKVSWRSRNSRLRSLGSRIRRRAEPAVSNRRRRWTGRRTRHVRHPWRRPGMRSGVKDLVRSLSINLSD
jgi:hypothetical protein